MSTKRERSRKTKDKVLKIPEDAHRKLEKMSKSSKLPQKVLMAHLIDLAEKYDLLDPEFTDFIQRLREKQRYEGLDKACPALAFDELKFRCIWGREGSPPAIKTLGESYESAKVACESCQETKNIIQEHRVMKKAMKEGYWLDMPFCLDGSKLDENMKSFRCAKRAWAQIPITSCKTIRKGANCESFRYVKVKVQGELPIGDHR